MTSPPSQRPIVVAPTLHRASSAWAPVFWVMFFAVALIFMVGAPFVTNRQAERERDIFRQEIEPFQAKLDGYHRDTLRLSTQARSYAAIRNPEFREYALTLSTRLTAERPVVLDAGDSAGFGDEAAHIADLVEQYRQVTLDIIAAEDAGNDFESFRLIDQEGEPLLQTIDSETEALRDALQARRDEIRSNIDAIDRRGEIALVLSGAGAAIAAAALAWLLLRNATLSRRIGREQQRLNNVISDVPGVVWEAWGKPDASNQRIDFVSPYVEEMLGYTTEEWLSTPNFWLSVVHPDDRERAARESSAIFASGGRGSNEFRWVTRDGRTLWVQAHSSVILDDGGAPVGMRGVTLDITFQKHAEQALQRERARFASIIASTDYGVYQADADGKLEYMNPAAEEMLGYKLDEIRGRETHPIFHQFNKDGTPLPLEECPLFRSSREDSSYRGQEIFCARNGHRFPVEVASSPVIVDGRSTGAVIVFQNITERLRHEQLKDDFVAFASHELRNPLTSLKGFSLWLQNRVRTHHPDLDPDTVGAIDSLVEDAARMESIIDLFLDLARIESDRLMLDLEPVDLRRLLDTECERVRQQWPGVSCELDIDTSALPRLVLVLTDEHRLRQVIGNLLDNGAKYGGQVPQLKASLSLDGQYVEIRIRDNGQGIPLEDQPFVFDRYYRGRDALASRRTGLGVGLFISKQIADRLGGDLSFTSVPGQGTEFRLRLLLAELEDEDEPSLEPPPPAMVDEA